VSRGSAVDPRDEAGERSLRARLNVQSVAVIVVALIACVTTLVLIWRFAWTTMTQQPSCPSGTVSVYVHDAPMVCRFPDGHTEPSEGD